MVSGLVRTHDAVEGILLAGAALLHALSIPFTLLVLKITLERQSSSQVTWDFFFSVLEDRGTLGVLFAGATVQVVLAVVAAVGAVLRYRKGDRSGIPRAIASVGAFGVAFSLLVFGGIFGFLGGILSIAAGLRGGIPRRRAPMRGPHREAGAPGPPPLPTQMSVGAALLIGACCLHVLAVPISLIFLKASVEQNSGRTLSWGELFAAVDASNLLPLLVALVLIQFLFAFVAVGGTLQASRKRLPAIPMLVAGIIAIPASILLLGGITGALGGCFSIVGGIWEMIHRETDRHLLS